VPLVGSIVIIKALFQNVSHCSGSRNTSTYLEETVRKSPCQSPTNYDLPTHSWLIHDPTSWGHSTGAISMLLQMLAYGGNSSDLFRGAFMQSGAPIPVGSITEGQVGVFHPMVLGETISDVPCIGLL